MADLFIVPVRSGVLEALVVRTGRLSQGAASSAVRPWSSVNDGKARGVVRR